MDTRNKSEASSASSAHRNNILVMAVCVLLIFLYGNTIFVGTYNFDVWNILATGREILENGIPYENPFSMIPGMQIVIQQWLLCVLFYVVYEGLGLGGISLLVTLVFFAIILVLYRIMRIKRHDLFGGEWILLLLLLVMVTIARQTRMVSTPFTILILALEVMLLELYRRDSKIAWLGCIVGLVVVHMQLHMSFIYFDLILILCYLIPDFITPIKRRLAKASDHEDAQSAAISVSEMGGPALAQASYKRLPLLVLLIVAALATLINPYGIDGALYILNSYDAASYGNVIPELQPQMLFIYGVNGVTALACVVVGAMAIGKAGWRRIDLPAVLIFIGCTYLGFSGLRNLWMLGLPAVLLGADMMRGWYIPRLSDIMAVRGKQSTTGGRSIFSSNRFAYPEWAIFLCSVLCTAGVGIFAILVALNFNTVEEDALRDEQYTPRSLINAIGRDVGKAAENGEIVEVDDLKIFNPTVLGGFMEWEGYPVYNDSRAEIWNSKISGLDQDLHNEYVDMTLGKWSSDRFDQFVEENDFDYLIVEANSPLDRYLSRSSYFQNILGTQYYELYKWS